MPNDQTRGSLRDLLNEISFPSEFTEFARAIGVEEGTSNSDAFEMVGLRIRSVAAEDVELFFNTLPYGWNLSLDGIIGPISHGDMVGSFMIRGRNVHAFAHMGNTEPMEMGNPALAEVFKTIEATRNEAIVLHLIPSLIEGVRNENDHFLHGGWHLKNGTWAPFLITPLGTDDLPMQRWLLENGDFQDLMTDSRAIGYEVAMLANELHSKFHYTFKAEPPLDQDAATSGGKAPKQMTPEEEAVKLAPAPLLAALRKMTRNHEPRVAHNAKTISNITQGYSGLRGKSLEEITPDQIQALLDCSTAQVSPERLSEALNTNFGWVSKFIASSCPGREEGLVGHGNWVLDVWVQSLNENVSVYLHGGPIDPTASTEDFALRTNMIAVETKSGRDSAMILSMNPMAWEAPTLSEDGGDHDGKKPLAILAGYLLLEGEWHPITMGGDGNNLMLNIIDLETLEPKSDTGYTYGFVGEDDEWVSPLTILKRYQTTLDLEHDLGPFDFDDRDPRVLEESYTLRRWGENRFTLVDPRQAGAYGSPA